jgi:hypothetical protein
MCIIVLVFCPTSYPDGRVVSYQHYNENSCQAYIEFNLNGTDDYDYIIIPFQSCSVNNTVTLCYNSIESNIPKFKCNFVIPKFALGIFLALCAFIDVLLVAKIMRVNSDIKTLVRFTVVVPPSAISNQPLTPPPAAIVQPPIPYDIPLQKLSVKDRSQITVGVDNQHHHIIIINPDTEET